MNLAGVERPSKAFQNNHIRQGPKFSGEENETKARRIQIPFLCVHLGQQDSHHPTELTEEEGKVTHRTENMEYDRSFILHRREPSPRHIHEAAVLQHQMNALQNQTNSVPVFQIILTPDEYAELQRRKREYQERIQKTGA